VAASCERAAIGPDAAHQRRGIVCLPSTHFDITPWTAV
jgi:hypothetical protein